MLKLRNLTIENKSDLKKREGSLTMNNVTLAHIGGDLVIIGGVAFYFHRKTNFLQEQISDLQKENKELHAVIADLQSNIQDIGTMIYQMQRPSTGPRHIPRQPSQRAMYKQQSSPAHAPKDDLQSSPTDEDYFEDGDLDSELANEYKQLDKERQKE